MVKKLTFSLAILALLPICSGVWATTQRVDVNYVIDGKVYSYSAKRDDQGYTFNKGAEKKVRLATLDWPPYIGERLCNKGWVFQMAVALLTSKGYQVTVQFFPWARSVKEVESGNFDILFPEYFIEETAPSDVFPGKMRREQLVLSSAFPGGEIGFMKRKGQNIDFTGDLAELIGESIGVVRGYQNTPDFDAMMDEGAFRIIQAVDDFQLMKLLNARRVRLIIGDPTVLTFSVKQSDLSDVEKAGLLANTKPLKPMLLYHPLYFALSNKTQNWQAILRDINDALAEFEKQGILAEFQNHEPKICQ